MNRSVQISPHTPDHLIMTWLCAHVGEVTSNTMFNARGQGWTWHYALIGQVIIRMHRIEFEHDVDADVVTQFALTFS